MKIWKYTKIKFGSLQNYKGLEIINALNTKYNGIAYDMPDKYMTEIKLTMH